MPSRAISAFSTEQPTSATDLLGNVGSTTRRFNAAQAVTAGLGAPTSGAILTYSSGSSVPAWSIPTSGAVLVASSLGVPAWRALGTSGQILESTGGTPTWVSRGTTQLFVLTNDTTQAIGLAAAAINFNVETVDTDGFHSTVTASSQVVIPTSGVYEFGVSFQLKNAANIMVRIINGSTEIAVLGIGAASTGPAGSVSGLGSFDTSGSTIIIQMQGTASTNELSANSSGISFWGKRIQ